MSEPDRQKDDARLRVDRSLFRDYRNLQEARGSTVRKGLEMLMRRELQRELVRLAAKVKKGTSPSHRSKT